MYKSREKRTRFSRVHNVEIIFVIFTSSKSEPTAKLSIIYHVRVTDSTYHAHMTTMVIKVSLSLSLFLSHTHTYTHTCTHSLSLSFSYSRKNGAKLLPKGQWKRVNVRFRNFEISISCVSRLERPSSQNSFPPLPRSLFHRRTFENRIVWAQL